MTQSEFIRQTEKAAEELPASSILLRFWNERKTLPSWVQDAMDLQYRGTWQEMKVMLLSGIIRRMAEQVRFLDTYNTVYFKNRMMEVFFVVTCTKNYIMVKYKSESGLISIYEYEE